jgi:hypothetical protein
MGRVTTSAQQKRETRSISGMIRDANAIQKHTRPRVSLGVTFAAPTEEAGEDARAVAP